MPSYSKYDVILVRYPFSDLSSSKVRPAVTVETKRAMDAAIAGLIGAAIGAVARMAGTLITAILQAKQEHTRWIGDKRVEAYSNTVRYLVKALNKRSSIVIEGGTLTSVMGKDVIKE